MLPALASSDEPSLLNCHGFAEVVSESASESACVHEELRLRPRGVVSVGITAGFAGGLLFHVTSRQSAALLPCVHTYVPQPCVAGRKQNCTCSLVPFQFDRIVLYLYFTYLSLVWWVGKQNMKTKLHLQPCSLSV